VPAFGQEFFEAVLGERNGVRRSDADNGESVRARGIGERALDRVRIGQKSRST
jgi:hypothetical protein